MSARDTPLREATQAQLVEELARRLNDTRREEPPEHWCDECVHFRTTPNPSRTYNPCSKRQTMSFYVPQPGDSPETFGYYREVCAYRKQLPEPTKEPT